MGNYSYARESLYQKRLVKKLERMLPGCVVIKNDPANMQGIPDLMVLVDERWLMLEVKLSSSSDRQPNQEYYIRRLDEMGFAAFISPDNEEQVLNEIQSAFGS